jgi:PadR family transcriptional regulator AphA
MSLRHTLLAILHWTPLHGYALREAARSYAWLYPMSNTNIYPTLASLEGEDFVSHHEVVVEGRLRKVYSISEAGRDELRRWLADPGPEVTILRDPGLLKVCFLQPAALGAALPWVQRDLDSVSREVAHAEKVIETLGDRLPKFNGLVGEYGLALARLRKDFLARVIREMTADMEAVSEEAGTSVEPAERA